MPKARAKPYELLLHQQAMPKARAKLYVLFAFKVVALEK